jgi:hypothetical protein
MELCKDIDSTKGKLPGGEKNWKMMFFTDICMADYHHRSSIL